MNLIFIIITCMILKRQYIKSNFKRIDRNKNNIEEKSFNYNKMNILNNINKISKLNFKKEKLIFLNSIFYKSLNSDEYLKGLIFLKSYNQIKIYDIYGNFLQNIPIFTNDYNCEIVYFRNEMYYMIILDRKMRKIIKYQIYFNNNYNIDNNTVFKYTLTYFRLNLILNSELYLKNQSINEIKLLLLEIHFWKYRIKKLILLENQNIPHILLQIDNNIVIKLNIHREIYNNSIKINYDKNLIGSLLGNSIGINKLLLVFSKNEILFYSTTNYSLRFRCLLDKRFNIQKYSLVNKRFLLIVSKKYFHLIKIESSNCYPLYNQKIKKMNKIKSITTIDQKVYINSNNKLFEFDFNNLLKTRKINFKINKKFGNYIKCFKYYNFNERYYLIIQTKKLNIYEISSYLFNYKETDNTIIENLENIKFPIFILIFIIMFFYNLFCYNKKSIKNNNNYKFFDKKKDDDLGLLKNKLNDIMKMKDVQNLLNKNN